ncbi:MAG: winged helix-turn-helix domain-containing protein [Thermoprotei archaeon]
MSLTRAYKNLIMNVYGLTMQKIDKRTAKILEYISSHGTTNISEIAKNVNMPITTVYGIIKRLQRKNIVNVRDFVNFTALGLTQYSVIFYYSKKEGVKSVLAANKDYQIYFAKSYCEKPCIYAKYVIPINNNKDFIEFLNTAIDLKLIDNYEAYATTNSYIPPLSFKNFDFRQKTWIFDWEELLNNLYLTEPQEFLNIRDPIKVELDNIDLKILFMREINSFTHLSSIKRIFSNVSLQSIYYHYSNHIRKNNIISATRVILLPYPYIINDKIISNSIIFFVNFNNTEWMNRFINALKDTCFLYSTTRIFGENTLIVHVYLPYIEQPNFLQFLDKLIEDKIISYYRFFIIDPKTAQVKPLPYHTYDAQNKEWHWPQDEYILKLQSTGVIKENNMHYSIFPTTILQTLFF